MEQSTYWEANRFSASQEIPHILWNLRLGLPSGLFPSVFPSKWVNTWLNVPDMRCVSCRKQFLLKARWNVTGRSSLLKNYIYTVETWNWFNDLYSLPNSFRVIKSRRMGWAGHVARIGDRRGVFRVLMGKPEGKRPLGRPRHRWENNVKTDL
jgi:hypothetical protein